MTATNEEDEDVVTVESHKSKMIKHSIRSHAHMCFRDDVQLQTGQMFIGPSGRIYIVKKKEVATHRGKVNRKEIEVTIGYGQTFYCDGQLYHSVYDKMVKLADYGMEQDVINKIRKQRNKLQSISAKYKGLKKHTYVVHSGYADVSNCPFLITESDDD